MTVCFVCLQGCRFWSPGRPPATCRGPTTSSPLSTTATRAGSPSATSSPSSASWPPPCSRRPKVRPPFRVKHARAFVRACCCHSVPRVGCSLADLRPLDTQAGWVVGSATPFEPESVQHCCVVFSCLGSGSEGLAHCFYANMLIKIRG